MVRKWEWGADLGEIVLSILGPMALSVNPLPRFQKGQSHRAAKRHRVIRFSSPAIRTSLESSFSLLRSKNPPREYTKAETTDKRH